MATSHPESPAISEGPSDQRPAAWADRITDAMHRAAAVKMETDAHMAKMIQEILVVVREMQSAPIPKERRDDEAASDGCSEECPADDNGYCRHASPALRVAAEERRETRDEEIAALRQENARLRALLPYVQHRDMEWMGPGDGERWTEACKLTPSTNRFGVVYGSAAKPHACTCGLDDLRATPLKEPR